MVPIHSHGAAAVTLVAPWISASEYWGRSALSADPGLYHRSSVLQDVAGAGFGSRDLAGGVETGELHPTTRRAELQHHHSSSCTLHNAFRHQFAPSAYSPLTSFRPQTPAMATINWRTINIDALDPDSPANFDLSSLTPAVAPVSTADVQSNSQQIRQLLRGGDNEGALQSALENPPYGADEKGKVRCRLLPQHMSSRHLDRTGPS